MIDSHMHLNMTKEDPIDDFISEYKKQRLDAAVLILLSPMDMRTYFNARERITKKGVRHHVALTYDPHDTSYYDYYADSLKERNVEHSIKLHPRRNRITKQDFKQIAIMISNSSCGTIIVDNFYWGSEEKYQVGTDLAIFLAKEFSKKKFVLAHFGGIHSLDVLMRTHEIPNIYYDISFTLNYLYNTSAWYDLGHCIRYSPGKVMIGSDYPEFSLDLALESFNELSLKRKCEYPTEEIFDNTSEFVFFR